ncbi:LysR family transcriptional regulator [Celerinatantimonas yamalensis]|uniref:LysR family transcriptional regulator n=1 Tax=Celerinatantimonas yamalensis TaxID=559956 RepID=A0ABW9G4I8_9GAMM
MNQPDFNLLLALDALLSEQSVVGAARRLNLSTSAMSRTLSRIRTVTGDPLLVRAGRNMVLTPYAQQIREQTQHTVFEAQSILRPNFKTLETASLERTFVLRTNDGFVEALGPSLISQVAQVAPLVQLRFTPKSEKNTRHLREGLIDLEMGVGGEQMGPEIRIQMLFQDRFIGVINQHHPLAQTKQITVTEYIAFKHVVTSRRGLATGPIDRALDKLGLQRHIAAVVPSFNAAFTVAMTTDFIALVPESFASQHPLINNAQQLNQLKTFELPVATPSISVSQMWHPRLQMDSAHRWFRNLVLSVCREKMGSDAPC